MSDNLLLPKLSAVDSESTGVSDTSSKNSGPFLIVGEARDANYVIPQYYGNKNNNRRRKTKRICLIIALAASVAVLLLSIVLVLAVSVPWATMWPSAHNQEQQLALTTTVPTINSTFVSQTSTASTPQPLQTTIAETPPTPTTRPYISPSVCAQRNKEVEDKPTMTSIGYLGKGFDIIFANPIPQKPDDDLGYRQSVFDMTNYCGDLTGDRQHRLPANVSVLSQAICSTELTTEIIETVSTLYNSYGSAYSATLDFAGASSRDAVWMTKVIGLALGPAASGAAALAAPIVQGIGKLFGKNGGGSSSGFGISFGGNRDFRSSALEIKENKTVLIQNRATCTVYNAIIDSYVHPQLTSNFRRAVTELPSDDFETIDPKDQAYARFFNAFGTHVVTTMTMGAAFRERYTVEESLWIEMKAAATKWSWESSLRGITETNLCRSQAQSHSKSNKCSNSSQNVGFDGQLQDEVEFFSKVKKMLSSLKTYTLGAMPPSTLNTGEWSAELMLKPMPVSLKVELIVDFLTEGFFPDDPLIHRKRAGLLKSLATYCEAILLPNGRIKSCDPFADRKAPPQEFYECRRWKDMGLIQEVVRQRTNIPSSQYWILQSTFNHKIYLLFKNKVSRSKGSDPCRALTKNIMKLAEFPREDELNCVTRDLSKIPEIRKEMDDSSLLNSVVHLWVGMKKFFGAFVWESDGSPFAYTSRMKNENSETYVMLQYKKWWFATEPGFHYFPHRESDDFGRPLCQVRDDFTTRQNVIQWGI